MTEASKPLPVNQEEFERALFSFAVRESVREGTCSEEAAKIAMQQFEAATVSERWGSGAGFYVYFKTPEDMQLIPEGTILEANYLLKGLDPIPLKAMADAERKYNGYVFAGMYVEIFEGKIAFIDAHTLSTGLWPTELYDYIFDEQ